jgi:molybdopterin-guanine dinucleotide biosynthesis protein A
LDGRSLLEHAIHALEGVCDEVIVAAAPGAAHEAVPPSAAVRFVHDPRPDGGPLVGLVAGLEAASNPVVIITGGDMPALVPGVLELIIAEIAAGAPAAALEHGLRRQPLPCGLARDRALPVARALLAAGRSSLSGLLEALDAVALPTATWRARDPGGRTLIDVDRPADLERLSRRGGRRC